MKGWSEREKGERAPAALKVFGVAGSMGEMGSNLSSHGVQASPQHLIAATAGLDAMCECKWFQGSPVVKSHR